MGCEIKINITDLITSFVFCIDFTPHVLVNESETATTEKTKAETKQIEINIILNVAAQIGDEETLKLICEVLDVDYDEIIDNLPDEGVNLDDAKDILDAVETDEELVEEGADE